ncbi:notochord homeobox [Silurus meridionalis]|nr:notochord homeobox [Silurus meridionalis]
MDTTCCRGTPRFPLRAPANTFSIDYILSSGHRKPTADIQEAYTQPKVIMRGALFPTFTTRPFVGAFGSACVYAPHVYHHRQNAAYRHTERRLPDGHRTSDLTYTGDFSLKTCRRIRTVFSAEQLHKLEEVFAKQRYMTGSEKVLLASALRLTETQVKVWFQNRRTKWRKSRELGEQVKEECNDLKQEMFTGGDGELKSVDSDEAPET